MSKHCIRSKKKTPWKQFHSMSLVDEIFLFAGQSKKKINCFLCHVTPPAAGPLADTENLPTSGLEHNLSNLCNVMQWIDEALGWCSWTMIQRCTVKMQVKNLIICTYLQPALLYILYLSNAPVIKAQKLRKIHVFCVAFADGLLYEFSIRDSEQEMVRWTDCASQDVITCEMQRVL